MLYLALNCIFFNQFLPLFQHNQSDFKASLKQPIKLWGNETKKPCVGNLTTFVPTNPFFLSQNMNEFNFLQLFKNRNFVIVHRCKRVVIEVCILQFWSEIILVVLDSILFHSVNDCTNECMNVIELMKR